MSNHQLRSQQVQPKSGDGPLQFTAHTEKTLCVDEARLFVTSLTRGPSVPTNLRVKFQLQVRGYALGTIPNMGFSNVVVLLLVLNLQTKFRAVLNTLVHSRRSHCSIQNL